MMRFSLKRRLLIIILGVTILSQLLFLYVNVRSFKENYHQVIRTNLTTIGDSLKERLNYILAMGISINKLVGLESLLKEILSDSAELRSFAIRDQSGDWLYYCDRKKFLTGEELVKRADQLNLDRTTDTYRIMFPLTGPQKKETGRLFLLIDESLIRDRVKEIALDSATVILISVLAIIDFLLFIVAFTIIVPLRSVAEQIRIAGKEGLLDFPVHRTGLDFLDRLLDRFDQHRNRFKEDWIRLQVVFQSLSQVFSKGVFHDSKSGKTFSHLKTLMDRFHLTGKSTAEAPMVESPVLIRPAVFMFVFSEALSISFLPLFAKELYRPLWNLSEEIVIGLPISSFMLFIAIALPIGGALSDIVGRKKAFISGALLCGIGLLLTGMAQDVVSLILYRSLVGFGFGIVFMTSQTYIIDTTTTSNRAEGLAMFISAFYGGTLCGTAIGGMLADRIGYRAIFFVGAALTVGSIFFLYLFLTEKEKINKPDRKERVSWSGKISSTLPSPRKVLKLFSDREFVSLVLFQNITNKICLIGFVYYLAPLVLKDLGNSQSDTGRYIMGYSLVMILLSQAFSRWSDRHHKMKASIFWGGIVSGLALIPFFFIANTLMVALGILILGFSHALSVSNQTKMATQLQVVKTVGLGQSLGIYRLAERLGNVIAPILTGILLSTVGYAMALALLGVYTVISSLLYLLITRKRSHL
ncbi:MAG: MFS transporter [Deltaproteobacteria bacterium]|nr:MFS transporter [Deltaproteobacteria bacterium]